jgi:Predicted transcriptional regulators
VIERATLPVESLTVDPLQSRNQAWQGDERDQQLAASIDEDGLYHDVLVRPLDAVDVGVTTDTPDSSEPDHADNSSEPEYAIIAGSRRYHAAMEAGHETLPCKILTVDDLDAAWASLNENTDRRDLSEQELANQLNLIYELVRPRAGAESSDIGAGSISESLSNRRFETERAALEHLAKRQYGRTDDNAVSLIKGHLRTANLPPVLQALFKDSDERTAREQKALDNYGIGARTTLGSGDGKSGTSREVVALHDALTDQLATDSLDATDAVLDAVGSIQHDTMSEQELRRSLRDFRNEVSTELDSTAVDEQNQAFRDTLQRHAEDLRELHEEVEPQRPFKRVDVMGPKTHQHSRWHAHAMQSRDADSHGELVRKLYTERLEELADQREWD